MEGAALQNPAADHPAPPRDTARDVWSLVLLLLLATAVRAWLVGHTEVAARDSIGYIRYALKLEHEPWEQALRNNEQHPGYPAALLAVSLPVRHFLGRTDPAVMQLSAQLTSALAGVLLVVPMFYLGKELFDRRVGFWAAALFQCLPVSGRILSDGLSEGVFLLFTALALLLAVRSLRIGSAVGFGLAGLFGGLAYLTRPEGALIVASALLVLVATRVVSAWRRPWLRTLACGASLAVVAAAVAAPYVVVTGHLTIKPTAQKLLETTSGEGAEGASLSANEPLFATILAVWSLGHGSLDWGVRAVFSEVVKGYFYVAWLPALAALWWFRGRLWAAPGAWVLLLLSLLHALVLWRLAAVMGYVSERHALVLVFCGIFWAAAGLAAVASRLPGDRAWLGPVLLLALAGCGLAETLKPLHANRAGHHAAGLWLAQHATPADEICDPFCWAHYYAGRVLAESEPSPPPSATHYVVLEALTADDLPRKQRFLPSFVERSDNHDHARLPLIAQAQQLAAHGQIVYHWPVEAPEGRAKVVVYAVKP